MRTREVGEIALGHRRILSTPFVKQALYFGGNADFFFGLLNTGMMYPPYKTITAAKEYFR
jgi:hypothetical protein